MSILSMPTSRPLSETELEQISQLAVTLSGRLTRVPLDDIAPVIAEALQRVATATCADGCQLVEFSELGAVAHTYLPAAAANGGGSPTQMPVPEPWLTTRLAAGELVAITRPEELPQEATVLWEQSRRTGACSLLGVPASVADQVVCALVIESSLMTRRWPQALIERLQLVTEILGAALQRRRQQNALRSSIAEIERLNAGFRPTTST